MPLDHFLPAGIGVQVFEPGSKGGAGGTIDFLVACENGTGFSQIGRWTGRRGHQVILGIRQHGDGVWAGELGARNGYLDRRRPIRDTDSASPDFPFPFDR